MWKVHVLQGSLFVRARVSPWPTICYQNSVDLNPPILHSRLSHFACNCLFPISNPVRPYKQTYLFLTPPVPVRIYHLGQILTVMNSYHGLDTSAPSTTPTIPQTDLATAQNSGGKGKPCTDGRASQGPCVNPPHVHC